MRYGREAVRYSAVLFVCVLTLAACGGAVAPDTVPRSPEATMAIKGRAVISSARAVLPVIDSHMTLGLLPKPAGILMLKGLKIVGEEGGRLAQALAVMDAAAPGSPQRSEALLVAQVSLGAIQMALARSLPADRMAAGSEVAKLLATLTLAVNEVTALVAQEGRR